MLVIAFYMLYTGTYVIFAGFMIAGAIFLLFFAQDMAKKDPLSEQELKILLFKQLEWKKLHPLGDVYEIPYDATIKIMLNGRMRRVNYEPHTFECGYRIMPLQGVPRIYTAEQCPYTGKLWGSIEQPWGYTGRESPNLKVVLGPRLREQRFIRGFLGGKDEQSRL